MSGIEVLLQVLHEGVRGAGQHPDRHGGAAPIAETEHHAALVRDGGGDHVLHVGPPGPRHAGAADGRDPVTLVAEVDDAQLPGDEEAAEDDGEHRREDAGRHHHRGQVEVCDQDGQEHEPEPGEEQQRAEQPRGDRSGQSVVGGHASIQPVPPPLVQPRPRRPCHIDVSGVTLRLPPPHPAI